MNKKLLALLFVFLITLLPATVVRADDEIRIFYAGPKNGVWTALNLARDFVVVQDIEEADVLVLNGEIPASAAGWRQSGKGLVFILGPELGSESVSSLLGFPVEITLHEDPISLDDAPGANHPMLTQVLWNSAPQVRQRSEVNTPISSVIPLVSAYDHGEWVLWMVPGAESQAFILNAHLSQDSNPQIQEWPYFNYLVYNLVSYASGRTPLNFGQYPASPTPHAAERLVLLVSMLALLTTSAAIFMAVRRYSQAHPEALDSLVVSKKAYESRQANTLWEEVGFHRPLGGFLLAFMTGLVFFIPLIIYQSLILPVYILPSAQALGIWGRVTQFFNLLWTLFDMGTALAFVKFFSQYRVTDPRQAVKFAQVYVWWQALSGAIQVSLIVLIGSFYLPETAYALYSWSVIIHCFIQIPGFYTVMRSALRGWQRSDYGTALELGASLLFPMITQPILVLAMAAWGRSNPIFGQSMGGLLGMGLAAYATEALTFVVGLWLYKRLGYNAQVLFLAHFDIKTIWTAFRFGFFEMLGSAAWAAGQAIEIFITQTRLINYTEIWGNWVLAQNFVFAFNVTATLYDNLMPSISESVSNAYLKLSQYYSVMAYKWGGLINGFIAAVLLAVTDRFILGATGPEFTRAAAYAIPLILWGAIQYPSWVGDNVQAGSNRPYLKTALVAFEQIIRVVLAFILLERFQIYALIIAYFAGLLAKDITAYFVNHKICFPQRFYFWQSLGAPLLAGVVHYWILRWLTGIIWQGDEITSILIFLIGILFSFPLYAFLYGLVGGWDDGTLDELQQAASLSGLMKGMAWIFWYCSSLGARISPLHNRFPITIRAEAVQEAAMLTRSRVDILRQEGPEPMIITGQPQNTTDQAPR